MERRKFLQQSAIASAGILAGGSVLANGGGNGNSAGVSGSGLGLGVDFPVVRVAEAKRNLPAR
jgi:hypothetical protein